MAIGTTPRAPHAAAVTIQAAGTVGTNSAHHAFPGAVELTSGKIGTAYRRGTAHASWDGDLVWRTFNKDGSGVTSEVTLVSSSAYGWDMRDVAITRLVSGRIWIIGGKRRQVSGVTEADGYGLYSDDEGATWSAVRRITNAEMGWYPWAGLPTPVVSGGYVSQVIEKSNGDLYFIGYGTANLSDVPGVDLGISLAKSTDGGTTITPIGVVAPPVSGTSAVEPMAVFLRSGKMAVSFHYEDGPPQTAKLIVSTDSTVTAWSAATTVSSNTSNRAGLHLSVDGDLIYSTYIYALGAHAFATSRDDGATFGAFTPISSQNLWVTPFKIGTFNTNPDVGFIGGSEYGSQDSASLYYRAYDAIGSTLDYELWLPAGYTAGTPLKLLMHCHAAGGSIAQPLSDSPAFVAAHDAGYAIVQYGPVGLEREWGNPASLAGNKATYEAIAATYPIQGTVLWGASMGGLAAASLAANGSIPKLRGVLLMYPVLSLASMYADNPAYQSEINTAYGVGSGASAAAAVNCDPYLRTASLFGGIPWRISASSGDTVVNKAHNATAFAAKIAGVAAVTEQATTGDHGDASNWVWSDFSGWVASAFGAAGPLTLATSAYWTQSGLALTVTGSVGARTSVQASVVSTGGGLVRFTGTDASRFSCSLDNSTWTPTVTVPAGTTTIYLSVLPQTGDTVLSASVGVPV